MTDDTRRRLHRTALDPAAGVLDEVPAGCFRLPKWTVVTRSGWVPMRGRALVYVTDIEQARAAVKHHGRLASVVWILPKGQS